MKFKIYKILDSTSSAQYWSFINEEKEDDEFIECLEEKEVDIEELKELFIEEDDLGKSVLFESLLDAYVNLKNKVGKILDKSQRRDFR